MSSAEQQWEERAPGQERGERPEQAAPDWSALLPALAPAQTLAEFAAALCAGVLEVAGAHGARVALLPEVPEGAEQQGAPPAEPPSGSPPAHPPAPRTAPLSEQGRGLSLCGPELAALAVGAAGLHHAGMHSALRVGPLLLEVVGAGARLDGLERLAPLIGLACEGAQARESRRGRGREPGAVTQLVRRMGGSLDLPSLLTATAETAAQVLGLQRAFVGLFPEDVTLGGMPGPAETVRTGEVYTSGFDEGFTGGIGVGPASFERLFRQGEAIVYRRGEGDARLAAGLRELAPETAVIAPLSARGRPLGVLYVDTRRVGQPVGEDDLWLALSLAEQASLSLDNARLYADETRKRHSAEALREVGAALSHSLRLADTLGAVLERASSFFGADACAVYELQPDRRTLAIRSAVGLSSEYVLRARARLGSGVIGRVVERGAALAVRDFPASATVPGGLGGGSRYTRQLLAAGRYPYRGLVALPLSSRGHAFGGLMLYFRSALPLGADELALAEVFAGQAALAIENARLYEEEVRRERESAVLLGVAMLLGGEQGGEGAAHGENEAALDEAARMAALAMNAERGVLLLFPGALSEAELRAPAADGPTGVRQGGHRLRVGAGETALLRAQLGRGPRRLTRRHVLEGAASGLVVPLRAGAGERVLGLLYADHPGEEAPSDRVLKLARQLASQMALALTRARLIAALEREEARYRQLAEGAHDLIITADGETGDGEMGSGETVNGEAGERGGVISYANPASVRLLGPLEGRSIWGLLDGAGKAALGAAWAQAQASGMQGGEPGGGGEAGRCDLELPGVPPGRAGPHALEVRVSAVRAPDLDRPGVMGMLLVARDISELRQLVSEIDRRGQALALADARQLELRSYLSLFTQAQEEERRRVSRELHDDTAQVLVATGRRLDRLARELSGEQQARAQQIRAELEGAIGSVRRFARNLRPSVLDDLGLLPALEWLVSQAVTPARLEVQGADRRLRSDLELTIFRVVQEALGNTDRHAHAGSAAVRVLYGEGAVTVTVSDDGAGFSAEVARARAAAGHLGLTGLRERVRLAGGELSVDSAPGEGTAVRFVLPG